METVTLTLTDFLLARIAEDEATANQSLSDPWRVGHQNSCDWWGDMPGYCTCDGTARLLAEVAAKRAILDLHSGGEYGHVDRHLCQDEMVTAEECHTVRALASVYAAHPDFRDEWRG